MRSPRYSTRAQSSHVKEEEQHVYSTRSHNTSTLREHKLEKDCAPEESNHEQPRMRTRRSRRNDSPENGPDAPFNEQTDDDTPPRISTRSSRRQEEASYRRETRAQHRSEAVPIEGEADSRDNDSMDMYTRVKRVRRQPKRDMYGFILEHDEQGEKTTEDEESEENQQPGENEENEETEVSEEESQRQYNLRQNKPKTQFFSQASEVVKKRDRVQRSINPYFGNQTPPKHKSSRTRRYTDPDDLEYRSPAHRRHKSRRKRRAAHDRSSSSTSTSGSDNEKSFARRKKKSMAKARMRCLPMNLRQEDVTNITNDRQKIGASLADIDPMSLDRSVTFESVGGLTNHLRSLKEMVVFPLLYPEVFDKFSITPPRGVLFYGPPGTGKTLVARALANECSIGDKRVAFFMRKGADCLSKWVGESERQLRLLFDQAYQMRPSIIFFDEIDGLAPVRSSRQDQIHSSIVSTLLALMDGLDSRGEVVVIGATNRIDSIDPALRRPGRFDREFLFTLPNVTARTDILKIHTKDWKPLLLPEFLLELAQKSSGYCGADLKSLCTEAALQALRRRYPQIYESSEKLQLDLTTIQVTALDFHYALKSIAPAARRAVLSLCRPLSSVINPLLSHQLNTVCKIIERSFPHNKPHQQNNQISQYDSSAVQRSIHQAVRNLNIDETTPKSFFDFPSNIFESPVTYKPRLLISGNKGQAHDTHLTPAVLHSLEYLPQHCIDLTTLYNNTSVSADEACSQVFREARRCSPSVLYIPNIDVWWDSIQTTVQHNIIISINELYLHSNVLLIVSISEQPNIPQRISELFSERDELYNITNPTSDQIREYFTDLILNQTKQPPPFNQNRELEVLPKAPPPAPSQLTEQEESALWEGEEAILRELRLFLRGILNKLASDRKFTVFTKPVDFEDVPDYYEIIKKPMDLSTIMSKIDLHEYQTCKQFLSDIDLICHNALEYNPPTSSAGRAIRHRACALKDTAYAMISNELDEEFEKQCESIVESRQRRGRTPSKSAPRYYHVQPDSFKCGRYSKRLRGETADLKTINDSLRHDRTLRHHDMPRHELHHDQHHDMKEHGDGETSLSAVKRKKRRRSNWSAGIIRKPKVSKSSPSKANRNQSETEDEEEKPDTQADDEVTFKVTGTEKKSKDEETKSKPIESNCQLPSDEEMDDSRLTEYSGIRENGELESENTETVQNGEPTVEQAEPDRSSPEQSTSEITVEKSPEVHIPTDKQQGVKLVNGDTPTKSGDTPTKSGDTPTKSGDTPTKSGDTPTKSGDTPTKSGDTPTKSGDTPTKSGDTPTKSADMERENSPRKPRETILIIEPAEIEELEIDTQVLQDLLELVVTVTRDYNINKLEQLYSNITSLIFQHRYSYNKRLLTQEIEQLLHSYRVDNTD